MTTLILCRTREVPTPEQIAEALCQKGYNAFVEAVNTPAASVAAEIRYAPNRMPIIIRYGRDFLDEFDGSEVELWHSLGNLQRNRPETSAVNRVGDFTLFPNKKAVHIFREKMLSELVPNEEARAEVRRFIYVYALESTDQKALGIVIDLVQAQTDGLLGSDIVLDWRQ